MSGWIKLHREVFDSDLWHDVTTFRLFIYLIGKASHADGHKYKGMILNKGQYVRSYRKLADDLAYKEGRGYKRYSLNTIKNCIKKLVDDERVKTEETDLGTLFTIVNYEKYQNDLDRFNALNTFETQNEGRTEVRTPEENEKTNNDNVFQEHEREPENTINNEPRTNPELIENEPRTISRIKELKEFNISTTTTTIGEPFRIFESEGFGLISPVMADRIGDFIDEYGEQWVSEAMKEAAFHGKRNLPYVRAILERWRISGIDEPWKVDKQETPKVKLFNRPKGNHPSKPKPTMYTPAKAGNTELSEEEMKELQEIVKALDG